MKDYDDVKLETLVLSGSIRIVLSNIKNDIVNEGINALYNFIIKHPNNRISQIEKELNIPAKALERWIRKLKIENKIIFIRSKKTGGYFIK